MNRKLSPQELQSQLQLGLSPGSTDPLAALPWNVSGQAAWPAPAKAEQLALLFSSELTGKDKENQMLSLISRVFCGKPLAVRLALGAFAMALVVVLSQVLPATLNQRPGLGAAFAETDGYTLVYDLSEAQAAGNTESLLDQISSAIALVRKEYSQANGDSAANDTLENAYQLVVVAEQRVAEDSQDGAKPPAANEEQLVQVIVKMPEDKEESCQIATTGPLQLMVYLPKCDPGQLQALQAELAQIPGLPTPKVTDATWFSEHGLPLPGKDALRMQLNLDDLKHEFSFPKDADAEQIQSAVNDWLKDNRPDLDSDVAVEIQHDGDTKNVTITIGDIDLRTLYEDNMAVAVTDIDTGDIVDTGGKSVMMITKNCEQDKNGNFIFTLDINGKRRDFSFAKDATAAEIKSEIKSWLEQKVPDSKIEINVIDRETDGKRTVRLLLIGPPESQDVSAGQSKNLARLFGKSGSIVYGGDDDVLGYLQPKDGDILEELRSRDPNRLFTPDGESLLYLDGEKIKQFWMENPSQEELQSLGISPDYYTKKLTDKDDNNLLYLDGKELQKLQKLFKDNLSEEDLKGLGFVPEKYLKGFEDYFAGNLTKLLYLDEEDIKRYFKESPSVEELERLGITSGKSLTVLQSSDPGTWISLDGVELKNLTAEDLKALGLELLDGSEAVKQLLKQYQVPAETQPEDKTEADSEDQDQPAPESAETEAPAAGAGSEEGQAEQESKQGSK